jgi:glycine cleavage system H lipoate-binding protein
VDRLAVPGRLFFADNHMWLDVGDDGLCQIGVDAFLTLLVGDVERLAFLTLRGDVRPAAVLTVDGVDLTFVFPHPMRLVAANTRLRYRLERLASDPYGLGWLFTARWSEDDSPDVRPPTHGLRRGDAARQWMASEIARLSAVVHEAMSAWAGAPRPADGGRSASGLARHLDREDALRLLADFFPLPGASTYRGIP